MGLSDTIRYFMSVNHMAPGDLASLGNMSRAEVHKLLHNKTRRPRKHTLTSVAVALSVKEDVLYHAMNEGDSHYTSLIEENLDVEFILSAYLSLPASDKLLYLRSTDLFVKGYRG